MHCVPKDSSPTAGELCRRGKAAFKAGRYSKAEELFALATSRRNSLGEEARLRCNVVSAIMWQPGRKEDALKECDIAIERCGEKFHDIIYAMKANVLWRMNDFSSAVDSYILASHAARVEGQETLSKNRWATAEFLACYFSSKKSVVSARESEQESMRLIQASHEGGELTLVSLALLAGMIPFSKAIQSVLLSRNGIEAFIRAAILHSTLEKNCLPPMAEVQWCVFHYFLHCFFHPFLAEKETVKRGFKNLFARAAWLGERFKHSPPLLLPAKALGNLIFYEDPATVVNYKGSNGSDGILVKAMWWMSKQSSHNYTSLESLYTAFRCLCRRLETRSELDKFARSGGVAGLASLAERFREVDNHTMANASETLMKAVQGHPLRRREADLSFGATERDDDTAVSTNVDESAN